MPKLCVYGTLMGRKPAVWSGRLPGLRMYSCGGFPACVKGEGEVTVEVQEVDEKDFIGLDRYEGVPFLYTRETVNTPVGEAFIYIYARSIALLQPVPSGDWRVFNESR